MIGLIHEEAIAHLKKDKKLAPYIEEVKLPIRESKKDVYSGLISSIVSQQLSIKAAATIHQRFLELFDTDYPIPKELLNLTDKQLRSVGLSGQKAKYVRNVALFFEENVLFQHKWENYDDEEIIILLTKIKGVGRWTVQMILMFVLQREDIFPVLDLGIQNGIKEVYRIKADKKDLYQKMEKISQKWKPYRTLACLYLWEIANNK